MNKFLAGTALAAVAIAAAPAAAQAPQGPRVEVLVGADIARQKIDGIFVPSVKLDDTGILYGIGGGYDFAVNDTVSLGVDVELTNSTAKIEKNFVGEVFVFDEETETGVDIHYRSKPRMDAYIGGRVSFGLSDTSNFYVKAGYSRLHLRDRVYFTDSDTGERLDINDFDPLLFDVDPADVLDNDYNLPSNIGGWRIGAGAQVALFSNAYIGGEVAYTDYSHDVSRIRAALLVGMRFGQPRVVEAPYIAPAPAPAPEPAPATQTCADGSVILATDACPVTPPAPAPERG